MTLQRELHDWKNQRRFHIGFRALPYPFSRNDGVSHDFYGCRDGGFEMLVSLVRQREICGEYTRWLRAVYPTEVALQERMLIEWHECGLVAPHDASGDAYVCAKARAAFRFISEADYQITVHSDGGDDYGDHGAHGAWPLVYSVYGERYRAKSGEEPIVVTCADCGGDVQPLHACPDFPTEEK